MSSIDPSFIALTTELGWHVRANDSKPTELIIGDYARGYLILALTDEIQVAQRSVRGFPSLRLRTNDYESALQFVAFFTAREVRRRARRPDIATILSPKEILTPFVLTSAPLQCRLDWEGRWADFGIGNEIAAAQFARYARPHTADAIAAMLE